MEQKIALIINTLNQIEVKGSGNLDKLLGCIQTLEKMLKDLMAEKGEEKDGRQSDK